MLYNGDHHYAEVLYFFVVHKGDIQHTLATVKTFSPPNLDLLRESYGILRVCRFPSKEGVVVVDAKCITDVVGMVPFHRLGHEGGKEFFPIEKMSLTSIQTTEDDDTVLL